MDTPGSETNSFPPSPAQPASSNSTNPVAGEGPGVREQQLTPSPRKLPSLRTHQLAPPVPDSTTAQLTQIFPYRYRKPSVPNPLRFPRTGSKNHRHQLPSNLPQSKAHQPTQAQALKGLSILARGSHRRWIPRVAKQHQFLPSPARPAPPNTPNPVAGEGPGVREQPETPSTPHAKPHPSTPSPHRNPLRPQPP